MRPGDNPDVMCRRDTGELYVNPTYKFLANLPHVWEMDKTAEFEDPGSHSDGKIYAQGPFITRYQSLQHARKTSDLRDYVVIRYHGTEVNVVVNLPANRSYKVYATLDGKPIPKKDKGDEISYDSRGSYFDATYPGMYNVIRGPYGEHQLKLASDSTDFDIYSYTFSGCPQAGD